MKTPIDDKSSDVFSALVDEAVSSIRDVLVDRLQLGLRVFQFSGPHLSASVGAYSPLDFLQLGMSEKLELDVHFLLIVTEVDLSATNFSFAVAFPSTLTNVGVLSTRRLAPEFWGNEADRDAVVGRLAVLMLHTIGHLLGLKHSEDGGNAMYAFQQIGDLDCMEGFNDAQITTMRRNVPIEAREQVGQGNLWSFALRRVAANWRAIWRAVVRTNPFLLATHLPTMLTAALSVIVVLFFSSEVWDVGGTVGVLQVTGFALASLLVATFVLYRAFAFGAVLSRNGTISESTVVTEAATLASLFATMVVLLLGFLLLTLFGAVTIFPRRLMTTWPTVDPVTGLYAHLKLSIFVAAMGLLAGSLGGRADSSKVIRHTLFVDEET